MLQIVARSDSGRIDDPEDLKLIGELSSARARESFIEYRRRVRPELVFGWWVQETSNELEGFYHQLVAGRRPKMLLLAPPQHGKTTLIEDFTTWASGRNPDLKTMFTSYSEDLGNRVNLTIQRRLDGGPYQEIFPRTALASSGDRRWSRNSTLLEFVDCAGSFRNTTVLGQCTGQALDLGLVDDPIKGRREAQSETVRDSTWGWLTDDFFTRFSDGAGLLFIMTRWHVDDPAGRFIERFPGTRVLRYPAIAEEDDENRRAGEPLFPEFKSLDFLQERRKLLTQASWESLYQQNPIIVGGGLFPVEKFKIIDAMPDKSQIKKTVRYWDKAGTADGGAYTAGVKISKLVDGRFIVSHVRRGQWSALEREEIILQTAQADTWKTKVMVEQEPGSGGKESAERTVRMLSGFTAAADRVTGKKEIRAEPYAAQVQAGNVLLLAAGWNQDFLDEHEMFPSGPYKDQVDAAAGAFMKLTAGGSYDSTMRWVA